MSKILPIKKVMPSTLKEFGLEQKAKSYGVITGWSAVVGDQVAAVTKPEKMDHGVLNVRVTSPVWRYELTMRKQEILAKLHKQFGPHEVKDIIWK